MKIDEIYNMKEYCERLKQYIEHYIADDSNIKLYGNPMQDLKDLINKEDIENGMFYVGIANINGRVTRVIRNGKDEIPFLDWICEPEESFTREYFENTMKTIWVELFE